MFRWLDDVFETFAWAVHLGRIAQNHPDPDQLRQAALAFVHSRMAPQVRATERPEGEEVGHPIAA